MFTKVTIAILCITATLITAMVMHIDGLLLAGGLTLIAGLGGFTIGKRRTP